MRKLASSRLADLFRRLSFSVALVIGIFFACLWCLLAIADMVFEDKSLVFDEQVFNLVHPYTNAALTRVFETITFFGSTSFLLPAYIAMVLYFLFVRKMKAEALKIIAVSVVSTVVLFSLKALLRRARPLVPLITQAHGFSFPSGHSLSSVVFYGLLAYIAYRNILNPLFRAFVIAALLLFALLIAFSRVYLRVHYASDVIAGICLGIMWLLLSKWLLVRTREKR